MYKQLHPLYPGVIHFTEGRGRFRSCPPEGMYNRKAHLITTGTSIEVLTSGSCKRDIGISVSPGCPAYIPLHIVLCFLGDCASTFWSLRVIGCKGFLLLKAFSRKASFASSSQMFGIDPKRVWFPC